MRAALRPFEVAPRSIEDYAPFAGAEAIERLRAAAEPLRGARVLHVSTAASGGRVAETLSALLPLALDCGVAVEWRVLSGDGALAAATDALGAGFQGAETALAEDTLDAYEAASAAALEALDGPYDLVCVHDPEPLGLVAAAGSFGGRWLWRCHVDAGEPDPPLWDLARQLVDRFELEIYPLASFAPPDRPSQRVRAIAPALDPLAPRHHDLPLKLSGDVLRSLGLDLSRPLIAMIGLDRFKDPHEVIDAFALAREREPDLQLALAGVLGGERSEDWALVAELTDYVGRRPEVHVLTNQSGVGNVELNALRKIARVCVQKSLREGYGLSVSEALWKGTPVIASETGGVAEQLRDGREGYLTMGTDETAARIAELVADPALAIELGESGRERVRERFLVSRLLEDELDLLARALAGAGGPATVGS